MSAPPAGGEPPEPGLRFLYVGWAVVLFALPAAAFAAILAWAFGPELPPIGRRVLIATALGLPPLGLITLAWAWGRSRGGSGPAA